MVIQITLNNRPIGRFLAPAIHPSTEDENVVFAQKRRFIEKRLNEKLSRYYILIHSIIVLLASISLIILQVVLIVNNAPCSTGSGIWVGLFLLLTGLVSFFLSKKRSYNLMVASFMLNFCSIFIGSFGSIYLNLICIKNSDDLPKNLVNLILGMLAVGSFASLICFLFILTLQCAIGNWKKRIGDESELPRAVSINTSDQNNIMPSLYNNSSSNQEVWYISPPPHYQRHFLDLPPSYDSVTMKVINTDRSLIEETNTT